MKKYDKLMKATVTLATVMTLSQIAVPSLVSVTANDPANSANQETPKVNEVKDEAPVADAPKADEQPAAETPVDAVTSPQEQTQPQPATQAEVKVQPEAKADPVGQGVVNVNYLNENGERLDGFQLKGTVGETFDAVGKQLILGYAVNVMLMPEGSVIGIDGNLHFVSEFTETPQTVNYQYYADTAIVKVNIHNETTGENLFDEDLEGYIGSTPTVNIAEKIKGYEAAGYELISSDYPDGSPFITNLEDYSYRIIMKHGIEVQKDSREVIREINSVNEKTGKTIETIKQSHIFTRENVFDKVTKVTTEGTWSDNNTWTFPVVKSKHIFGYTSSLDSVPEVKVNAGSKDLTEKFGYTPNVETAKVVFTDKTTGKVIDTVTRTGDFDTTDKYNAAGDVIDLVAQGYELVKNEVPETGIKFDFDGEVKTFNVDVVHGIDTKTETNNVSRTVNYKLENGKVAAPQVKQEIKFTRDTLTDRVTGEVTNEDWTSPTTTFDSIATPKVKGHTADKTTVAEVTGVKANDKAIVEDVVFAPNDETAKVVYLDTVTNEVLSEKSYAGKYGEEIKFDNTELNELKSKNYSVLEDPTAAGATYDVDGTEKVITVKLGHKLNKETESHDVTRTFSLQKEDKGSFDNIVQTVTFTRTTTTDLVTGEVTIGDWESANPVFAEVKMPEVKGYKPTVAVYASEIATIDRIDEVINVVYEVAEDETPEPGKPNPEKPTPGNPGTETPGTKTPGTTNPGNETPVNETPGNVSNGGTEKPATDNKSDKQTKAKDTKPTATKANGEDPQTGVEIVESHAGALSAMFAMLSLAAGAVGIKFRKRKS